MHNGRIFSTIAATSLLVCSAHGAYTWQSVQFRGGGYVPEVAFHPKTGGPAYARTDIGGAYRLDPANGTDWIPINDMFTDGNDLGSIAIGLDPDDTNYVYLTGGLYTSLSWCGSASFLRSSDRGASWTKIVLGSSNIAGTNSSRLTGGGTVCLAGNGTGRGMGPRLAVKGSTIYLGTNQNGLLRSTDRGITWTTIAALGDTMAVGSVLFDAAGNVYAAPSSGGLWKSVDGSAWTKIDGITDVIYQMKYSQPTNTIWLTVNKTYPLDQGGTGGGSVWKYDATAQSFAQVTMPSKTWGYTKDFGYGAVALDPSDANHVLVATNGWWRCKDNPRSPSTFVPCETIYQTRDGGKIWTDMIMTGTMDVASAGWAASSNPGWITALAIDPANSDHVIFGTGGGVWSTTNATGSSPTWRFTDKGIEETAPLGVASSTFGAPLVSVMGDVNGAYHADIVVPPALPHQVDVGTNYDISVASLAPSKMIRIYEDTSKGEGGWSEDGGKSWTQFASFPPTVFNEWGGSSQSNFGAISADGSSIVRNMQKNGVYWSKDKGTTWTKSVTEAALLSHAEAGFRVLADQATPGTFYIYNPQTGVFYRSTDDGANWSARNTSLGHGDSWAWQYFRAFVSPKAAGEVWITQGNSWTGSGASLVYRTTDGGATITKVAGLSSATAIGFGKGTTPAIPAIYAAGVRADNVKGLFRSTDDGSTWVRIDDAAHQYGGFGLVVGDPCIFSRVYVGGGGGRGILYAQESGNQSSCPDRLDYVPAAAIADRALAYQTMQRRGNRLVTGDNAIIRLTDLRGNRVRSSAGSMGIDDLPAGVYLASDGNTTLRIPVTR